MRLGRARDVRGGEIEVDPDLVDRLVELYCDWRTECAAVRACYERLSDASASERDLAFAAFTVALEREGSAAETYAAHLELIASHGTGDTPEASHRTRIRRER
jgi:hypothetical protein